MLMETLVTCTTTETNSVIGLPTISCQLVLSDVFIFPSVFSKIPGSQLSPMIIQHYLLIRNVFRMILLSITFRFNPQWFLNQTCWTCVPLRSQTFHFVLWNRKSSSILRIRFSTSYFMHLFSLDFLLPDTLSPSDRKWFRFYHLWKEIMGYNHI